MYLDSLTKKKKLIWTVTHTATDLLTELLSFQVLFDLLRIKE